MSDQTFFSQYNFGKESMYIRFCFKFRHFFLLPQLISKPNITSSIGTMCSQYACICPNKHTSLCDFCKYLDESIVVLSIIFFYWTRTLTHISITITTNFTVTMMPYLGEFISRGLLLIQINLIPSMDKLLHFIKFWMIFAYTISYRSRHASRHVRHARAVMRVGIANPR